MNPSILLLDCSDKLVESLKKQNFDIAVGFLGVNDGTYHLPSPIYEHEVIVFNPTIRTGAGLLPPEENKSDYSLTIPLKHIAGGAVGLFFVNNWTTQRTQLIQPYQLLLGEQAPQLKETKDFRVVEGQLNYIFEPLNTLFITGKIKLPVAFSIEFRAAPPYSNHEKCRLLSNRNNDTLAVAVKIGNGMLIFLPEFENNDEVVVRFLRRVVPQLLPAVNHYNLVESLISPHEAELATQLEQTTQQIKVLENEFGELTEQASGARREKEKLMADDPTMRQMVNYFDVARQSRDTALFYLYKLTETLQKSFGSEKEAKQKLGVKTEWNLIGRLANEAYDVGRHAPHPEDKIKECTEEEIEECYLAAEQIIQAYLNYLLKTP